MKFDTVGYSRAVSNHDDAGTHGVFTPPPQSADYMRYEIPRNMPTPSAPLTAQSTGIVKFGCCWVTSGVLGGVGLWMAITASDDETTQQQFGASLAGIFGCIFCYSTLFCSIAMSPTKTKESKPLLDA